MLDISAPMAAFLYNAFNVGLIGGATLVLISTIGAFWTSSVKERYSDERIALNESQTATARQGAAQADLAAAEANRQTAQLRVDLERERLERVRLQASVSSRHITPEQKSALREAIRKSFGVMPVLLLTRIGDEESSNYATDIIDALNGLITFQLKYSGILIPPPTGVIIFGPGSEKIMEVFRAANINVVQGPPTDQGPAQMIVGHKPPL